MGIRPGSQVVDVGCGPIGIINLLSEWVGPGGLVIGVEREDRFFETAQAERVRRGLQNVKLVHADAKNSGLPKKFLRFCP